MRFEQLEQFVALGNLRHFRQAAEQTNISTSALTRSIQTLEDEIGCELVKRSTRSVRLTEQGELFLTYCKATLNELENAKKNIKQSLFGNDQDKLVIGYTQQMSSVVPVVCGQFLAHHPSVKVEMQMLDETELTNKLQLGEIDISVCMHSSELASSDIYIPDQLIMFVARNHPLLQKDSVTRQDLMSYPMFGCLSQSRQVQHMVNETADSFNKVTSMRVGNINEVLSNIKNSDLFAIAGIEHSKLVAQDPEVVLIKTNKDLPTEQVLVRTNHTLSEDANIKELVSLIEKFEQRQTINV
ncbi:LysR family transcriptional regulator [Pseudoalteromonas phenolica]|uniref:LysR family transcriptional regulator n=1 Tax=Pseudoalteromonas phenolica TaxID=161398 RepID=A0A5R9PYJ1_9GAMM|nr:LysR family transcriptional regulator [Pseudoalteromonas phenolica]TLX45396.1 LysR family transcriptional regulator [Pseudoalteromonas phenolica]